MDPNPPAKCVYKPIDIDKNYINKLCGINSGHMFCNLPKRECCMTCARLYGDYKCEVCFGIKGIIIRKPLVWDLLQSEAKRIMEDDK